MNHQQENIFFALERRYGSVRRAVEKHGLHFYIPCPACTRRHGASESKKKHLSINMDALDGSGNTHKCFCNKCGEKYDLVYLMGKNATSSLPTLEKAAPSHGFPGVKGVFSTDAKSFTEADKSIISPGSCVPLSTLSAEHVAIKYLRHRKYDIAELERQWLAAWCTHGLEMGTTNRIIFYGRMFGSIKGWQARLVDYMDSEGTRWIWTPNNEWKFSSTLQQRTSDEDPEKTPKYLSAPGMFRSSVVLNLDTAVAKSVRLGFGRTIVLCEGMLDAARIGEMAVPLLGKSISEEQARIVKAHVDRVVIMLDPDAADKVDDIKRSLSGITTCSAVVHGYKDPGDAPVEEVWKHIFSVIGAPKLVTHHL